MLSSLNRNLRYLYMQNVTFGLSMSLIGPLFPLFLAGLGANELQNASIISMGRLMATAVVLPSGLLLNKMGKRGLLIGGSVVSLISALMFYYGLSLQQVTIPVMLFTASSAILMPARMAIITANSDPANRASVFGIMNTAWPLAGIVSPLISGYLIETTGWSRVFLAGTLMSAMSVLLGFRIQRQESLKSVSDDPGLKDLASSGVLVVLLTFFTFGFLINVALGGISLIVPLYLESRFALTPSQIGLFFTGQNLLFLVTQIPSGSLADKFGRKRMLLALTLITPFLYASWHPIGDWRVLLAINSLGYGLWCMTFPAIFALLSDSVRPEVVGPAFGVLITGNRLGYTVGPLIASFFYINYFPTAPFLVAGGALLLSFIVALRMKEKAQRTIDPRTSLERTA